MPRRKYYKKRRPRRYRKKRNYTLQRYRGVSALSTPLPDRIKTTLKYIDRFTLNPSAGGIMDTIIFRANSLYDPNAGVTGTNAQPRGFDEFMSLYDRYQVLGAKIVVTFANRDNNHANIVSLSLRSSVSTPASIRDYMESGNSKWKMLTPENGSRGSSTLAMKVNPNKYLNETRYSDNVKGTVGTNPDTICYWHLGCEPANTGTDTDPVDCVVEIHYIAEFTQPTNLSGS